MNSKTSKIIIDYLNLGNLFNLLEEPEIPKILVRIFGEPEYVLGYNDHNAFPIQTYLDRAYKILDTYLVSLTTFIKFLKT